MISYKCILESWKSEVDLVKSSIKKVGYLAEGVWNTCADVLDEWWIGENKESLEYLTPKIEAMEQVRSDLVVDIQDLAVMDSKVMHFSLISHAQMATQVHEHARITKKDIKEIASLVV